MRKMYIHFVFVLISLLTGCATVQTQQEWERVESFALERTGKEIRWEQSEEDVKKTQEEVSRLLSDGLTIDDAVKIALLNNRKLQATFEEIGIAKADLVQSGLFSNPSLGAVFRFPLGGGGISIEGEGLVNVADFWRVPLRKRVAAARLEAAIFRISEEILNTTAEAKDAFNEYVALFQIREETEKIRDQMEELKDHLLYRRQFGLSNDIDVYLAAAEVLDHAVELARIEKGLQVARVRLNRVLGLAPGQFDYEVADILSEEFKELPDAETLIAHALSSRPDVQVAKLKAEEAKRILALERKRIFNEFGIGAAYARESEGTDLLGPALDIRIPLFDRNQAQIAKAEFQVRQAGKELQQKIGRLREEVSIILEDITLAHRQVKLISEELLPLRKKALEYAEQYFDAMQLNALYLLDTRRRLSDAQKKYLEAVKEMHHREIELERALGGMLPASGEVEYCPASEAGQYKALTTE